MPSKLFLLDAYALIYRSYYAFIKNPRINSKGINTSAIFGFTNTLQEIIKKESPDYLAVVFDPPSPTFRNLMFTAYKANRESTPEVIKASVPFIKKLIEGFNIKVIEVEGFEADDTIGTLAKRFASDNCMVYMMTPDKDYTQLVEKNIKMYKPARSGNDVEIIGVDEVKQRFSISHPDQVKDILALWGDSSDNIPGAPGIGEKNAKKLIEQFGSVENLLDNTHQLSGKIAESLRNYKNQILLAKDLVTIRIDVPVKVELNDLKLEKPNIEILMKLFAELEFRTLSERFATDHKNITPRGQLNLFDQGIPEISTNTTNNSESINTFKANYKLIDTAYLRSNLIAEMLIQNEVCFDSETTGLNPQTSKIIGLSFCFAEGKAFYVAMPDDIEETKQVLNEFKPLFSNKNILKIGQNMKFDIMMLKNHGIEVDGPYFDTMIAHYLIEPEQKHNLDDLAFKYLNYTTIHIEELIGSRKGFQTNMDKVPLDQITRYAAEDADICYRLKNIFLQLLTDNKLTELFNMVEMPLIPVLASMEFAGICINRQQLVDYSVELKQELINTEQKIFDLAGVKFNIASPKQLGTILFEQLKITPNPPRTKTKQYATGEEILVKFAGIHPIVDEILEHRSISKLISTYVDALPAMISPITGRIHTTFNQTITATGRLSSVNPNLQNIPIKEERGRVLRKAFIPCGSDCTFFSADYSQIELRILAHVSGDKNMIEAFCSNNEDIHTATASKIFGVDREMVTREMRSKAKTANFGIIYGISSFGLSQRLNISRAEAKELIDSYFATFPGVKEYIEKTIIEARQKQYVETILGRRRYLPEINSNNANIRGFAERNAINAPIQGSAADIIKLAMINIHNRFIEHNLKSEMTLQVHDELNFNVHKNEAAIVQSLVIHEMENVIKLSVPLKVEQGFGNNWLEAH